MFIKIIVCKFATIRTYLYAMICRHVTFNKHSKLHFEVQFEEIQVVKTSLMATLKTPCNTEWPIGFIKSLKFALQHSMKNGNPTVLLFCSAALLSSLNRPNHVLINKWHTRNAYCAWTNRRLSDACSQTEGWWHLPSEVFKAVIVRALMLLRSYLCERIAKDTKAILFVPSILSDGSKWGKKPLVTIN